MLRQKCSLLRFRFNYYHIRVFCLIKIIIYWIEHSSVNSTKESKICNVNSVYVDNNHYSLIKFLSFMQMGSQFVTQVFQVKKKNKLIQSFQYIVKMISKKYILQLSICTNIQTPVPINENNMVKNRCGCIVHV